MRFKREISVLLSICLLGSALLISDRSAGESPMFSTGNGRGYSWMVNYSDFEDGIARGWQKVDYSYLSGGASEMFYIKCTGNDSGIYRFEYFGGNYVNIYLKISGKNATGAYNSIYYRAKYSVNYNGSFTAGKYSYALYSGGEEHTYYGIDNLTVNVGGDIYVRISEERQKSTGTWRYFMEKSSNISYSNLTIDFESPYPFVPAENSDWVYNEDIHIKYAGNRSGYIDYSALYSDGGTDSLKAYVGKHVSGTATVSLYSQFFPNGTMHAPSLIGLSQLVDMTPYKGYLLDLEDSGMEMEFRQRYENGTIIAIGQNAGPAEDTIWSGNATEEEVKAYLSNKEGYTPEAVEPTNQGFQATYILFVLVLAAVVSLPILFFALKRRGK